MCCLIPTIKNNMKTHIQPDLALIGGGYWGKNLARNFHALGSLHTLCDVNEATLAAFQEGYEGVAKSSSIENILRDPCIRKVAIATPAAYHFQIAKNALLAGKDLYVEKPLCLNVDEANELVQLAASNGRILMVGHLLQYHPCIVKLQELVASGELGRLYYITSNRLNLGKIRREENALWSFAPHDISVILSLVSGQIPNKVQCTGESWLNEGVTDTTLTAMRFEGGVRAHVYVSWLNPFKEQKLTVVGSSGMAVFDDTLAWQDKLKLQKQYITWTDGRVPNASANKGESVEVDQSEPLKNECSHFLKCCDDRSMPKTDGAEGVRVLRVLQMAQLSLELDGETVRPESSAHKRASNYFSHPTACIDPEAKIGSGTKIWHFSHVCDGAVIGENCNLGQNVVVSGGVILGRNVKVQNNVSIYTGTTIEDDVFLGPSCVLTNVTNPRSEINRRSLYEKTVIRTGATIGANATIVCGVTLGRYSFIAAGAVVTKDVPDYALMVGIPAVQKGWMSRHGHPLNPNQAGDMFCPESGFRYQLNGTGQLRCLDLDEDLPMPATQAVGTVSYDTIKQRSSAINGPTALFV